MPYSIIRFTCQATPCSYIAESLAPDFPQSLLKSTRFLRGEGKGRRG